MLWFLNELSQLGSMLRAALSAGLLELMRGAEYTHKDKQSVYPILAHCTFARFCKMLILKLFKTKTDNSESGVKVVFSENAEDICAIREIKHNLKTRGICCANDVEKAKKENLFCFKGPLKYNSYVKAIKNLAKRAGLVGNFT